ncbi:MAG: chemotaxis-specific protein-glutamate methyltransferase CheB [Polyangiaceae bacterium]
MNSQHQSLRVLVADRSVALRRLIAAELNEVSGIDVLNIAATAELAIEQVVSCSTDVLLLDVKMSATEVVEALRATTAFPAIVLLADTTPSDVAVSLEAIEAGAADVVTKLPGGSLEFELKQWVRNVLAPRIRSVRRVNPDQSAIDSLFTGRARPNHAVPTPILVPAGGELERLPPKRSIKLVAIGASTGGPKALAQIIPALPKDFPTPIVVVQHMPAAFTGLMASRLATVSNVEVVEASAGERLKPGRVYIAPGNRHLLVVGSVDQPRIELSDAPPENSCRPAVDVLFRSVSNVYQARALGVVLTGMGQDGLLGAEALRRRGSSIIAQDEASSVVWGMPGLVVKRGFAEREVPLFRMAQVICDEVLGLPRSPALRVSCP